MDVSDWMQCVMACDRDPKCCSYNYKLNKDIDSLCELNSCDGGDGCPEEKALQYAAEFAFHQLHKVKVRTIRSGC